MGKVYIDTVKYLIHADFEIKGLVEKPDVVGAVFGQTEGLLGDELDLREMQKSGRIGRIDVELVSREGKSVGKIFIPSSLDMVETSVIAAAIESVDRVGPCEAKITVSKIEDMRSVKRKQLVDRAKSLLKSLVTETLPESKEILDLVRDEVKVAGVVEYGPERLAAGPDLDSYDSVIVVEGRADVINLLKNDIKNVIALGGASVPKTIVDLSKRKEITLFLDGDRGGDIILKEVLEVAEVDFIARAPPGREVEELSRKEIIKMLRSKVPVEQAESLYYGRKRYRGQEPMLGKYRQEFRRGTRGESAYDKIQESEEKTQYTQGVCRRVQAEKIYEDVEGTLKERTYSRPGKEIFQEETSEPEKIPEAKREVPSEMQAHLSEINGTLKARLLDSSNVLIKELPVRDLITELNKDDVQPSKIVLDGIITQRLLDLAALKNVKCIVGIKEGNISKRPSGVEIYTIQ
ncbi:MAG: DNA primase DnaG [Candidatus Micrarchaeia archaeon]